MLLQRPIPTFVTLGLFSVCGACSDGSTPPSEESHTVRDSAGIEIVTNLRPQWLPGEEWRIAADPDVELGQLEGNAAELFGRPSASFLSDRSILVSEQEYRELRLFASDGTWLWTTGREGEGPGEFRSIEPARILPGDTILVFDGRARRASWFAPSGQFIRSVRIETGDRAAVAMGVLDPDVWLYRSYLMVPDSSGLNRWRSEILLVESTGARKAVLDTLTTDLSVQHVTGNRVAFVPLPFFARPIFAAGRGRAYVSDNTAWEILVYDSSGAVKRKIRRTWAPQHVTDAHVEQRLDLQREFMTDWDVTDAQKNAGLEMLEEGAGYTETLPAMEMFLVDRLGNLWVRDWAMPQRPHPERQFNVFDEHGLWLGPVTVPAGFGLSEIGDDYVVGIVEDELGVQRIRVHQLLKPQRPAGQDS